MRRVHAKDSGGLGHSCLFDRICEMCIRDRMGIDTGMNVFTNSDEKHLAERYVPYRDAGALQILADEMGRTKPVSYTHL